MEKVVVWPIRSVDDIIVVAGEGAHEVQSSNRSRPWGHEIGRRGPVALRCRFGQQRRSWLVAEGRVTGAAGQIEGVALLLPQGVSDSEYPLDETDSDLQPDVSDSRRMRRTLS